MPINQEMLKTEQQVFTKAAVSPEYIAPLAGAALGGGVGALAGGKNKMRNALLGALAGGGAGAATEYFAPGVGLGLKYLTQDKITDPAYRGMLSAVGAAPSWQTEAKNVAGRIGRIPEILEYGMRRESDLPALKFMMGADAPHQQQMPEIKMPSFLGGKSGAEINANSPAAAASNSLFPSYAERLRLGAKAMGKIMGPRQQVKQVPMPVKSARVFGEKIAIGGVDLAGLQKYLPGAGVGAGAGALVGGLGGLMFPGKRRGRLSGALRGALAGAGVGGLAGGAAGGGAFGQGAQNAMADVYKRLGTLYNQNFGKPDNSAHPEAQRLVKDHEMRQENLKRMNAPQTAEEADAASGEEYKPSAGSPPVDAAGARAQAAAGLANDKRTLLSRHPSAGLDYGMAKALSRAVSHYPANPKPSAPGMSQDLLDAYGEEPDRIDPLARD